MQYCSLYAQSQNEVTTEPANSVKDTVLCKCLEPPFVSAYFVPNGPDFPVMCKSVLKLSIQEILF